jgi:putative SOS response-associated peptidase YedK
MCGRFSLTVPAQEVADLFDLADAPPLAPRYNIAPTQPVLIVRPSERVRGREAALVHWGLIPPWAKDPSIGNRMINARAETAPDKPSFRAAFKRRRCLIPVDGFYEWKRVGSRKQPMRIRMTEGGLFAFAGLWEQWQGSEGEEIESCTILTTSPNEMLSEIHGRMPVIVAPEDFDRWLTTDEAEARSLVDLLRAFPAEAMTARPVSTRVNSPSNDDPACIEPIAGEP